MDERNWARAELIQLSVEIGARRRELLAPEYKHDDQKEKQQVAHPESV
jgi:hypothetical protein